VLDWVMERSGTALPRSQKVSLETLKIMNKLPELEIFAVE